MAKPLNQISGQPQMGRAFMGWMKNITLTRRRDSVVNDGLVVDSEEEITFKGVIQPLSARAIALKPDGQRAWQWLQIHCVAGTNLRDNDQIIYNGQKYKVMATWDYSLNGYIEYHVVHDFKQTSC